MVGRSPPRSYAFALARVFAPFFAAALRFAALRLRVFAAFLAAALRFAGPPVARSSISLASERRSLATFFTPFGVFRFARPVAWANFRAALLRSPLARSFSKSSSCLDFLAICPTFRRSYSSGFFLPHRRTLHASSGALDRALQPP